MSYLSTVENSEQTQVDFKTKSKTRLVLVKHNEDKQKFWKAKKVEYKGKIIVDDNGNETLVASGKIPTDIPILKTAFVDDSTSTYSHKKCKAPTLVTITAEVHATNKETNRTSITCTECTSPSVGTVVTEEIDTASTSYISIAPRDKRVKKSDSIELISSETITQKTRTRLGRFRQVCKNKWDNFVDYLSSKFVVSCSDVSVVVV